MKYEIVQLEEKILTVLKPVRVSNADSEVSKKIGLIWQNFYKKGEQVQNKVTGKPICTYSNYESNETGAYDIHLGYETLPQTDVGEGWIRKIIPAGKYAKFVIKGDMAKEVPNFWGKIWKMNLPRKFECDFEEYQTPNPSNTEDHVYISLL